METMVNLLIFFAGPGGGHDHCCLAWLGSTCVAGKKYEVPKTASKIYPEK